MKFVMGDILGFGLIGFVFEGMGGMLLAYIAFWAMAMFSVIGVVCCLKWLFTRKKKKEKGYKYFKS